MIRRDGPPLAERIGHWRLSARTGRRVLVATAACALAAAAGCHEPAAHAQHDADAAAAAAPAAAEDVFVVHRVEVDDPKSVFATVESVNVVGARARIGGTVAELVVDEGDLVEEDQVIAVVASQTLAARIVAINARIQGVEAERAQAQTDLARAEDLAARGVLPRAQLDEARTRVTVLNRQFDEAEAEREVVREQVEEGEVRAPATGRVLSVPVTPGAVVLPGEPLANIAAENYVLRLQLPERHARYLDEGDLVRVDAAVLENGEEGGAPRFGEIVQVYPRIEEGRVIADAAVAGLGDFFVGERIRVWVETSARSTFIAPERFIETRYGVDFVRVRNEAGHVIDVAVQRGRFAPTSDMPDGVEILSGLSDGDVLVAP